MLWPGTLIGAGIGYAVASIPGALLGTVLGQVVDRRLQLRHWPQLRERLGGRAAIGDEELLFVLLGRLAKSNGRVLPVHIHQARAQMKALGLDESARARAVAAFNRGRDGREGLRVYLRHWRSDSVTGEALLQACWRMAWADGKVTPIERALIGTWGQWLGWSPARIDALGAEHDPLKPRAPAIVDGYRGALSLLGVKADAEPQAIKRAYRRLLSRHHPDKLTGAGASAAKVREATEKTRELHSAYALIKARRGFR
ncbi:TerB family tellurite resistance protein [Pseudomonas syringae]|nr:TerB family tellurite resistance protein [Pseudomonas syringae]MBD8576282.1 TerB family tellurite resistance protein [Pseudomonas syringae]MBD8791914.1 TerB family tellurite resistance protein [Pseudomonas syringae]MBD8802579.1 TerB family tellurite resistance protein [Pseudomonas syringae]MBD8813151.1 TerB family tellurite resistance protein [Pseudomonas syringae]